MQWHQVIALIICISLIFYSDGVGDQFYVLPYFFLVSSFVICKLLDILVTNVKASKSGVTITVSTSFLIYVSRIGIDTANRELKSVALVNSNIQGMFMMQDFWCQLLS